MSTEVGRRAEQAAAAYLERAGFAILEQNWRTRWCEIDIIASKGTAIYFVEAKYRANERHGVGLDYVTLKKLRQMQFAAEFWLSRYKAAGNEYYLSAIELTGQPPVVTTWLPDVG